MARSYRRCDAYSDVNCRKMAICCFLLRCIKVSWRHFANLKQMLRICALLALHMSKNKKSGKKQIYNFKDTNRCNGYSTKHKNLTGLQIATAIFQC